MSISSKAEVEALKKRLVEYYDELSGASEEVWGEHIHHGFFEPGSTVSLSDQHSAQVRMIEEALRFASVSDDPIKKPKSIVDVGCGFGGSSRYLAKRYGAQCKGISLSRGEIQRAKALAAAQGLESMVSFEVADALAMPFSDGQFDLVWCMETSEHIADKQQLVHEMVRVAAPGATIILVSWCHRDLSSSEQSLNPEEKKLLNKICDGTFFAPWCSIADYIKYFDSFSIKDITAEDWSQYVTPFWPAMRRSMLSWDGLKSFFTGGWKTIKDFMLVSQMIKADGMGLAKLAIITCRKPA